MAVYTASIVTVSDKGSEGKRVDTTGQEIGNLLLIAGYQVVSRIIIPDNITIIANTLIHLVDGIGVDLVVTNGGTGVSPRDLTPEATSMVIEKEIPGIAEAMLISSLQKTPNAMLSRAKAGIRKKSLIINLPGSPRGASENLTAVLPALPHALAKIKGDPSDCAG